MFLLLVLLFNLKEIDGSQFFTQDVYPNFGYCKYIVDLYLNDQSSVTVFNSNGAKRLQNDIIIKAMEDVLPATIYTEINDALVEKIHDMGDELNVPSTSKSYFAMASSVDWFYSKLDLLSKVNTNGKWIFLLVNVEKEDVELLAVSSFKNHKMLNILMIFIDSQKGVFLSSFSPFRINNQGRRGEIWTKEVNLQNLDDILSKVDRICEKKVEDLQGFELKVATFYEASKISEILDRPIPFLFKKFLNCEFKYYETPGNTYGSRLENGSFTGEFQML
jgi:hypothetical protein